MGKASYIASRMTKSLLARGWMTALRPPNPTAILLIAGVMAGCVSSAITPDSADVASLKRIAIVPLEPPPLLLPSHAPLGLLITTPQTVSMAATGSPQAGAPVGALFLGIFVLAVLPEQAIENARKWGDIQTMLSSDEAWGVTTVIAQEIRELLGASRDAVIDLPARPIPGLGDSAYTWHMENWYGAIRAWYSETRSSLDHTELARRGFDAVLEVGLLNHEYAVGDFLLTQVMVKLVNPASGSVLGRARDASYPQVEALEQLFADEGRLYKTRVRSEVAKSSKSALRALKLIPE
jgi:hypothetical protein